MSTIVTNGKTQADSRQQSSDCNQWTERNDCWSRWSTSLQLCSKTINCDSRTVAARTKEHILGNTHKENMQKEVQPLINDSIQKQEKEQNDRMAFNSRLTEAFLAADIPLEKLANPVLRSFLSKETGKKIPAPNILRKAYVAPLADEMLTRVKKRVADNEVYFIIDETTDCMARYCVNVLVGVIDGKPGKTMLLNVSFIRESNNVTIQQVIHESCVTLWRPLGPYQQLRLVLTDKAAYMCKAIRELKTNFLFPSVNHISCLAHSLNVVANRVRLANDLIND